jgi:anti-sigma-K factor RskA
MTDEERRRTMEFILEQQAQFAANIQRHEENFRQLEEERIRDRPRLARVEESFQRFSKYPKTTTSTQHEYASGRRRR